MKRHWLKILAVIIVLAMWSCVVALGRGRYDFGGNFDGVVTVKGMGTGVLNEYGFTVADVDGYGMARIGCFAFGITNFNAGGMDLDGTAVIRNLEGPKTGIYEFIFEEGNGDTRFAISKSGIGNATYNARSMIHAGPAVQNDGLATFAYWQSQGIFNNLAGDTAGDGADLGVQNDFEVMGDIFATGLSAYADNAAAVSGGLAVGQFYRTGGDSDLICVVH